MIHMESFNHLTQVSCSVCSFSNSLVQKKLAKVTICIICLDMLYQTPGTAVFTASHKKTQPSLLKRIKQTESFVIK